MMLPRDFPLAGTLTLRKLRLSFVLKKPILNASTGDPLKEIMNPKQIIHFNIDIVQLTFLKKITQKNLIIF